MCAGAKLYQSLVNILQTVRLHSVFMLSFSAASKQDSGVRSMKLTLQVHIYLWGLLQGAAAMTIATVAARYQSLPATKDSWFCLLLSEIKGPRF